MARALFRCGDYGDLGRTVLTAYTNDLRGHFARHAKAVLEAEQAELAQLPEPVGQVYRRYQVAHQNGDQSGLAQVQAEVAQYRQTVAVAR